MSIEKTSIPVSKVEKTMKYPSCWDDDERMNVLMSPFRPRSVNAENYDIKIKFWKDMIKSHLEFKGSPSFNKSELMTAFTRKNRSPYDLDRIIDSMRQNVEIRLRPEYLYDPNNSWTGWAINSFVRKPISWGYSKIYYKTDELDPEYVHLELAKEMTDTLDTVLKKFAGQIVELSILAELIEPFVILNNDGLEICLQNLSLQRKVLVDDDIKKEFKLIKIPGKGDQSTEITDADRVVFKLEKLKTNISTQLNKMEEEIKRIENLARQHIREGKRNLAKSYLRKKHVLEKCHENRSNTVDNIETLLASVEEAQSNGELLNAFMLGTKVLKELNENKFDLDSAEDVMDDVQDVLSKQREIQDRVSSTYLDNENFDMDALEKELESIVDQNESKTKLPSPTINVNSNNNFENEISDQELLKLLDNLEVDTNSVESENTDTNKDNRTKI